MWPHLLQHSWLLTNFLAILKIFGGMMPPSAHPWVQFWKQKVTIRLQLQQWSSYLTCAIAQLTTMLTQAIFCSCWGFCKCVDMRKYNSTCLQAWTKYQSMPRDMCDHTCMCLHTCKISSICEKSPMPPSLWTVQSHMPNRTLLSQLQHYWLSPFAFKTLLHPLLSSIETFDMLQCQDALYFKYTNLGLRVQFHINIEQSLVQTRTHVWIDTCVPISSGHGLENMI